MKTKSIIAGVVGIYLLAGYLICREWPKPGWPFLLQVIFWPIANRYQPNPATAGTPKIEPLA